MKIIKLPLFWKFAIALIFSVIAFGVVNLYQLWNSVYISFEKEIDKRCIVLSKIISEKVTDPIIYEDVISVYNILEEIKKSDNTIAYIFLTDIKGKVTAKTYDIKIPDKLAEANSLVNFKYNIKLVYTRNYKYKVIRDIAYPILNGKMGTVRLGLVEGSIQEELMSASKRLIIMILVLIVFGLLGAFIFSYLISYPVKLISKEAQKVDLELIKTGDFHIELPKHKKFLNFYFQDELDILIDKYTEMMLRLKMNLIELQETRDSLVQAEKLASIGTLTSGLGHEINNPISGIKNCINRIAKDPENAKQNLEYFYLIKEAVEKIENVVKHLLNFSRKQKFVFESVNPIAIVESAISIAGYKIESNNILVSKEFTPNLKISASSNHLQQVILNLILNAADAGIELQQIIPEFKPEIHISIVRLNKKIQIRVKDNGTGIPEEFKKNIFDPFFSTKEVGKGTGLGLFVSFNIIKEHKGKIYLNSQNKTGTEFIVEFADPKGNY